ncbi:hypothetical protein CM49_01867 [Paenibacillus sp. P1XP2]|nr:hypothetical protein CM49_01867 [Paenibacillus sp. P1XP2]
MLKLMMPGNDMTEVAAGKKEAGRWCPDSYLKQLAAKGAERAFRPGTDWPSWRKALKERVASLLGGFPERAAALDPVVLERTAFGDHIRERVEITTCEGLRMRSTSCFPWMRMPSRGPSSWLCTATGTAAGKSSVWSRTERSGAGSRGCTRILRWTL